MSKAEEKEMTALLRVCRKVYRGEMTILLSREHFYVELEGNTKQELMDDLKCFANDLFELLHPSDSPSPDYRFIRLLCKVFRTQLSSQRMLLVLESKVRNK